MSDAPVERHHREWTLRALGETDTTITERTNDALDWLGTGEFNKYTLAGMLEEDIEALKICDAVAQTFANFEFEVRTETDAALKESKEHAQALDANWDRFCRISLDAIRTALDLDEKAAVSDMVSKILQLRGVTPS